MAEASAAVAKAQGVLRQSDPTLIVDGRWGTFTHSVYQLAPDAVKFEVEQLLQRNGTTVEELWTAHQREKTLATPAYLKRKAEAREMREDYREKQVSHPAIRVGKPEQPAPQHVVDDAIRQAAVATGMPERLLRVLVHIESRGRSNAENGSSRGLMQMQPAAWVDSSRIVRLPPYHQGVWDPHLNVLAGAAYAKLNRNYLQRKGVANPEDPAKLYLAHQQGLGGFMELWQLANGIRPRTNYVTEEKMRRNPPQDRRGVTLDKKEFATRWLAHADSVAKSVT